MSRSPLTDLLRRAYYHVRAAGALGMPVREHAEMHAESLRTSRRHFLEMSGAPLALALAACTPSAAIAPRPPARARVRDGSIAIVGAGIAGLHCAYRLRKRGVRADVYEASDRLGGRIQTDRTSFPQGMHVELGGELIDSTHTTLQALARELGLTLLDYGATPPMLEFHGYVGGALITERDILDALPPLAAKIDDARAKLNADGPDQKALAALDAMSIAEWLDAAGASGPLRKFLEAAFVTEIGLELDVSNALDFLYVISTDLKKLAVFGRSDERLHVATGNASFIEGLAGPLADSIHTSARLVAIRKRADGHFVLSFDRERSGGGAFEATVERVVFALPFSVLRDVSIDASVALSPRKLRAIKELGYGSNAKIICGFASRIWRDHGMGGGEMFTDLAWQSGWETSRLQPGTAGIITNYAGGRHGVDVGAGTSGEQASAFLEGFEKLVPGAKAASNGRVVRAHWPSNPYVKGSYSAYMVGQYTAFAGSEGAREGNVFFCGEHTSEDFPGFMEGAARSGALVAKHALREL